MKLFALLFLAASSFSYGAEPGAQPKVAETIDSAVKTHKAKDHLCVVSHQMEVAGNFHPESAEAHTDANYIGLEKSDCPSEDKKAASVVPAGR